MLVELQDDPNVLYMTPDRPELMASNPSIEDSRLRSSGYHDVAVSTGCAAVSA